MLMDVIGGLKASTLDTLWAWGRPVAGIADGAGVEVGTSGAAENTLGIERVFLSFRTGGERLPSCAVGDFGGA